MANRADRSIYYWKWMNSYIHIYLSRIYHSLKLVVIYYWMWSKWFALYVKVWALEKMKECDIQTDRQTDGKCNYISTTYRRSNKWLYIKNLPYGTLGPEGLLHYDTDLHYGTMTLTYIMALWHWLTVWHYCVHLYYAIDLHSVLLRYYQMILIKLNLLHFRLEYMQILIFE